MSNFGPLLLWRYSYYFSSPYRIVPPLLRNMMKFLSVSSHSGHRPFPFPAVLSAPRRRQDQFSPCQRIFLPFKLASGRVPFVANRVDHGPLLPGSRHQHLSVSFWCRDYFFQPGYNFPLLVQMFFPSSYFAKEVRQWLLQGLGTPLFFFEPTVFPSTRSPLAGLHAVFCKEQSRILPSRPSLLSALPWSEEEGRPFSPYGRGATTPFFPAAISPILPRQSRKPGLFSGPNKISSPRMGPLPGHQAPRSTFFFLVEEFNFPRGEVAFSEMSFFFLLYRKRLPPLCLFFFEGQG